MSTFRLVGLPAETFAPLFAMSDAALADRGARRVVADEDFGFPCRVSLADAQVGDELLLLPFEHLVTGSPYRSGGAIYVRRGARPAALAPGEIPPTVSRRLMSLRAYDADDMMIAAEVCEGAQARGMLERFFADPAVAFVHLHNARRGCFSCRAERVAGGDQGRA